MRSDIQMVFQDPYGSLNPRMKVQDLIGEPLLIHTNMSAGERLKKVHELLGTVGLSPSHGERYPHEFSGGQRQRIGIARAPFNVIRSFFTSGSGIGTAERSAMFTEERQSAI